ncbi:winged helix-turn-helix domain-containing protein [Xanthomonas sp.]|uniref:winged helix-turn-helix domain-containing protein n=1 Tax=Xanthomonas sp. TaxID=29446 RepID=UPI001F132020|nr:winged helix-turn-helix domain-containing protein [Xanthomonas sp.]
MLPERMQVGDCLVVMSLREVHAPGARRPQRLTPKAMGVLRALLAQPGQVVEREALLELVWPDTQPTNDVVTQAVTQLRKAFAAGARGAPPVVYIETLAKTGYRLVAAVQALPELEPVAAVAEPAAAQPSPPVAALAADVEVAVETTPAEPATTAPAPAAVLRRPLRHALAAAGIGLCLVLALLVFLLPRLQSDAYPVQAGAEQDRVVGSPERPYRLITTAPGFELEPTLSPDGAQVAYASSVEGRDGTLVLVQNTDNSPPRRLSEPDPAFSDRLPAWSPDGRRIAFARLGANGFCQVMVIAASGAGTAQEAARCDGTELLSFDWTPDGQGLLFGSMTGRSASRALRVLDLRSGRWQALPYAVGADDFDYAPRYSPDGKWIAFVRNPQMGGLWRMPAAGGAAERLTGDVAEIRGWAWTQDSRGLVFGRRVDSETRLYRLDVASLRLRDLGLGDAQAPTLSRDGHRLGFVHRRPQFALYRVSAEAGKGKPEHQRLFASTGRDGQPAIAPDGRQLVFTSDRSGSYALWWGDVGNAQSLRLIEGLHPETRQAPGWSADSRSLLVSGRDAQGRAGLFEVWPQSGRVEPLPVPDGEPLQGVYAADPSQLLVLVGQPAGRTQLRLYDRRQQPWKLLAALDGVSQARFDDLHQQVLFTRPAEKGVWRADAQLRADSVAVVDAALPSLWRYRTWALGPRGEARYLFPTGECASRLNRIGGGLSHSVCLDRGRLSAINGFSIDRHSGDVYVALAVEDGSDIGFMNLPEKPGWFSVVSAKWLFWLGKPPS